MKKLKIAAIISGILTLLQLLPAVIPLISLGISLVRLQLSETNAGAIGIIGGADGPTAIYTTSTLVTVFIVVRYLFFAACALTFIISSALLIKNGNKNNR